MAHVGLEQLPALPVVPSLLFPAPHVWRRAWLLLWWLLCRLVVPTHLEKHCVHLRHLRPEPLWWLVWPPIPRLAPDRVTVQEQCVSVLLLRSPSWLCPLQGAWVARDLHQHWVSDLQLVVLSQLAGHIRVALVLTHVVPLLLALLLSRLQQLAELGQPVGSWPHLWLARLLLPAVALVLLVPLLPMLLVDL